MIGMSGYVCLASMCVLASAQTNEEMYRQFDNYQQEYAKHYDTAERRAVAFEGFAASFRFIQTENAKGHSFKVGLNAFSDMLASDFRRTHFGAVGNVSNAAMNGLVFLGMHDETPVEDLPSAVDWRDHGAVTGVKDQGGCGSCWSFSTTGALEGAWKIATGTLVSLSEQQFLECDFGTGGTFGNSNWGCGGGEPYWAFDYVTGASLCTEWSYSYTAQDPDTTEHGQQLCKAHTSRCSVGIPRGAVKGYKIVRRFSDSALMSAVAQQPISVGIDADADIFRHYSSGAITGSCGLFIDHAVLLVGYGTENGVGFYLVKNSWGSSWGDEGYVRIARGGFPFGKCSITSSAHYPVVVKPSEVALLV